MKLLLIINPSIILTILILYYREEKKRKIEKLLFGSKIKDTKKLLCINLISGMLMGIIGSIFIEYLNIKIDIYLLFICIISILLSLIDNRFLCITYSGGLVSIGSVLINNIQYSIYILYLIGIFHLLEGLLIYMTSYRNRNPLYLEEQGQIKAGYYFNIQWSIPIFIMINGYFMILPFILGYKNLISSGKIKVRTENYGLMSILYGGSIIIIVLVGNESGLLIFLISLLSIIIHELIIKLNSRNWLDNRYLDSNRGIKVLDVIDEKSPLKPLDIIIEINNDRVDNIVDIKNILLRDGKYYSMKYINEDNIIKQLEISSDKLNLLPFINNPLVVGNYSDK